MWKYLEFFHLVTDAHIIPSSHISVPSHTNIPDTVAETSLNHFACQVVTAQRAYTGLALYKCIHMETAGPLSGSHAIISPYITSFMGPVRSLMKPYQIHASRWALSSDIKCMLHVFYTAARSLMFPAVYCGLKYLTSSRDLAAIWDISLLIPADCYKQMLNVRLNEDRISVWTIMFSRSDGVSFHIVRSFGDKAGYEAGFRHNITVLWVWQWRTDRTITTVSYGSVLIELTGQ